MKMARPPEVCIKYDEDTGTVSKNYEIDTDELALYNDMRETLIFLTNLGGKEMQQVMLDLLKRLTDEASNPNQRSWNPTLLNCLCWALGSISGSMSAERERIFLVHVIKELLWLCEHKRGKENKAVVASMIMYVFGQYPRFLRSYVRFLDTVVTKIFEFMCETFPGVQEMACETFMKISQKCAKSLATIPENQISKDPIIQDLLPQLHGYYIQLQTLNKQLMLYEGIGYIIAAVPTLQNQQNYIQLACSPFASEWTMLMMMLATASSASPHSDQKASNDLFSSSAARKLTEILRVYDRLASTTGTAFSQQLSSIYLDMMRIYGLYSTYITEEVSNSGPFIITHQNIKILRSFKKATILLLKNYVEAATTINVAQFVSSVPERAAHSREIAQFIVPLMQPLLEKYKSDVPQARDHETLILLSSIVTRLNQHILLACAEHCFDALFSLPVKVQQYFIESLLWAIQHEHPSIADQGLVIMETMLKKISATDPAVSTFNADSFMQRLMSQILTAFFQVFYWGILVDILTVLTDTLHKAGFQYQALILMYLIQFVELGKLDNIQIIKPAVMYVTHCLESEHIPFTQYPIYHAKKDLSGVHRSYIGQILIDNFKNLHVTQVEAFVLGLFNKSGDPKAFSRHIRDLLIQVKEFSESSEVFEVERQAASDERIELEKQRRSQIPGFTPQYKAADRAKPEDFDF